LAAFVERARDLVPEAVGRIGAAEGQQRRDLAVLIDLGPGTRIVVEVGLDDATLIVVDGVEGVGAEKLVDVVRAAVEIAHDSNPTVMPAAASS
jgi:hypothetical protein